MKQAAQKIVNAGKIEKAEENSYNFFGSLKELKELYQEQSKNLTLEDFAIFIERQGAPLFPPTASDQERWSAELSRGRLLILSSFDQETLHSASQAIFGNPSFSAYKLYSTAGSTRNLETLHPLVRHAEQPSPLLFLVEAYSRQASPFLDSVSSSPGKVEVARSLLSQDFLIVLTNDKILGRGVDAGGASVHENVPYHRVPFLMPRLLKKFGDEPDLCAELCEAIEQQYREGRWGESEQRLYELFSGALKRGTLREEVARRKQPTISIPTETKRRIAVPLSPKAPLENAALFLATFFPRLPMRDFQRLLLDLVGDRQQETKTQAFLLSPEGDGRVEEITENRSLRAIWEESYPEVLERCHLVVEVAEAPAGPSRNAVVEFSPTELREEVRNALFGAHYPLYLGLFRQVRERRFLFDESPRVVDQAVELMVGMALSNSAELAGPWLGGLVPLDQLPRIYPLLRAFLQNAPLHERVAKFFQEMLLAQRFDELMGLAWKLRDIGGVKAFVWLKRVLDEGTAEARQGAYGYLLQTVCNGGAAETLEEVFGWLPKAHSSNLAHSSTVAESFFLEANAQLIFDAGRRRKGWPPSNPILAAAHRNREKTLETLAVQWLFHPATANVLDDEVTERLAERWFSTWLLPERLLGEVHGDVLLRVAQRWIDIGDDPTLSAIDDESDLDLTFFPALVLADWAVELLAEDPVPAEARAVFDRLLAALAKECSAAQRQVLCLLWSTIEESLLDLLLFLEETDPMPPALDRKTVSALRQDLQTRRRSVRQLRLDLQSRRREASRR